jgi:carbonic anhydrase
MKRLYVRRASAGGAWARARAVVIEAARRMATAPQARHPAVDGRAQRLYRELGFVETAPYNDKPVEGTRFLALDLVTGSHGVVENGASTAWLRFLALRGPRTRSRSDVNT